MEELPVPDEDAIRQRAWEISQRANGGTPEENWQLAAEELRGDAWEAAKRKQQERA